MAGVNQFSEYENDSMYQPFGRKFTGNPMIDLMIGGMVGRNYTPRPGSGQDMWDAFDTRSRTVHMANLQGSAFSNSAFSKRMGLGNNPAMQMLGQLGASPDSAIGNMMSPLLGGNPMAAQMQIYGGLTGANVMGNWGRSGNINESEAGSVMDTVGRNFYKTQKYEGAGGMREEMIKKSRSEMERMLGSNNASYFKDLGMDVETKNGMITSSSDAKLRQKIGGMDITGNAGEQLINTAKGRQQTSSGLSQDLDRFLNEQDENVKKTYKESLKEKLKALGGEAKKHISALDKKGGDMSELRTVISDYAKLHPQEAMAMDADKMKAQGERYTGFDFAKSRGFKLEDFTSAFRTGAELRMLGNNKNESIAQTQEGFMKNAGGVLSAGGALFGRELGGAGIMQEINKLVGTSNVDTHSEEGAGKLEALLRKVKATAGVAGVSIKTMLAIIDQTKQLAASNPRLASMNEGTLTEIGRKSVSTAAKMGSQMSAEDFRKAGGTVGIAAGEQESALTYALSGHGTAMTNILGMAKAKGGGAFEKISKMVERGEISEEYLAGGGAQELAGMLGMDSSKFNAVVNSETMASRYNKDKDVTDAVEAGRKSSTSNVYKEILGVDKSEIYDKFKTYAQQQKAEGKQLSVEDFFNTEVMTLAGGEEERKQLQTYENTLKDDLFDQVTPKDERNRIENQINERAAKTTELEKKYSSLYSPLPTQLVNALVEGKGDFAESKDAIEAIFSTKSPKDQGTKDAMQFAGDAVRNMYTRAGSGQVDDSASYADVVNVNDARWRAAGNAKENGLRDDLAGNLSEEDYKTALKTGSSLGAMSSKEAQDRLDKLSSQDQSNWGTATQDEFTTLQAYKTAGLIGDDSALKIAMKGGARNFEAATIEAAKNDVGRRAKNEVRASQMDTMGAKLQAAAEGTSGLAGDAIAQEAIANYNGDYSKMFEDQQKGAGWFAQFGEGGDAARVKAYNSSKLGGILNDTSTALSESQRNLENLGGGAAPANTAMEGMGKMLSELMAAITDGGGIAEALRGLATALK
jgi:hypothetical protein